MAIDTENKRLKEEEEFIQKNKQAENASNKVITGNPATDSVINKTKTVPSPNENAGFPNMQAQSNSSFNDALTPKQTYQYHRPTGVNPAKLVGAVGTVAVAGGMAASLFTPMLTGSALSFLGLTGITAGLAMGGIGAAVVLIGIPILYKVTKKLMDIIKKRRAKRQAKNNVRSKMLEKSGVLKQGKAYGLRAKFSQWRHNRKMWKDSKKFDYVRINCGLLGGNPNQVTIAMMSRKPENGRYILFSPYVLNNSHQPFATLSPEQVAIPNAVDIVHDPSTINEWLANDQMIEPTQTTVSNSNVNKFFTNTGNNTIDTLRNTPEPRSTTDERIPAKPIENTSSPVDKKKTTINKINKIKKSPVKKEYFKFDKTTKTFKKLTVKEVKTIIDQKIKTKKIKAKNNSLKQKIVYPRTSELQKLIKQLININKKVDLLNKKTDRIKTNVSKIKNNEKIKKLLQASTNKSKKLLKTKNITKVQPKPKQEANLSNKTTKIIKQTTVTTTTESKQPEIGSKKIIRKAKTKTNNPKKQKRIER